MEAESGGTNGFEQGPGFRAFGATGALELFGGDYFEGATPPALGESVAKEAHTPDSAYDEIIASDDDLQ